MKHILDNVKNWGLKNCVFTIILIIIISITANSNENSNAVLPAIINAAATAVFGGLIFAAFLNFVPDIILANKIAIRFSPQGTQEKVYLGVLAGNKTNKRIYDVHCGITCVCSTKDGKRLTTHINSLDPTIFVMHNVYRIAFDIKDLPKQFWINYLSYLGRNNNEETYKDNYLEVVLCGKSNQLGGNFSIYRKYMMDDLKTCCSMPETKYNKNLHDLYKDTRWYKVIWDCIWMKKYNIGLIDIIYDLLKLNEENAKNNWQNMEVINWDSFAEYLDEINDNEQLIVDRIKELIGPESSKLTTIAEISV